MIDSQIETFPSTTPNPVPGQENGPNSIDTNMVKGNYAITPFGYADNFDVNYNFVLPFYIDTNVTAIVQVYLNLLFQKYRAFSKANANESAHTHSVVIPNHTHTVAIGDHTHALNGIATDDEGTGSTSHQHGSTIKHKAAFEAEDKEVRIRSLGTTDSEGKAKYQLVSEEETADFRLSVGFTDTGHHHDITGKATASGGAATPTSASGGGSTVASAAGSAHTHATTFGIYEAAAYPTNVGILIDSVSRTVALGGPWNPTAGDDKVLNLDLTKYITTIGYHTIEISTDDMGRCIPFLWIKQQSKK
jgi:hypothetical protein